ncbi:MAG TPA: 30S ribosomal protein S7 [Firmicutes bacterium]|nr:30S ribosomal protein S7 [Bacillota bacterium]
MSRKKTHYVKRDIVPDPVYNSKLVTRLINKIMMDGKKGLAQHILYEAFDKVEKKTGKPAMDVFEVAIGNIMPELELKATRVGAANLQIPVEVSADRKVTLGLRWLVGYARLRSEKTMADKLAAEIIDAANNTGAAVKKKEDTHKTAEANKAYAHYRR